MNPQGKNTRSLLATAMFSLGMIFARCECLSQGTIYFETRVSGEIEAPVTFLDGTRVTEGFTAQLFGGPAGTPVEALQPLLPTTVFRTSAVGAGHVVPITLEVPGVPPGESGTFIMRAYNGSTWELSDCRGESNPVTVLLTPSFQPPSFLAGLQPFQVNCVPESPPLALLGCGIVLLAACRVMFTEDAQEDR